MCKVGYFTKNGIKLIAPWIIIFGFVVAICDLVHDVETIFHLSYLLTAYGNLS